MVKALGGRALGKGPTAMQIASAVPEQAIEAMQIAFDHPNAVCSQYDEVNLNCGCPSSRVLAGSFGASLMLDPERTASIVAAIRATVPPEVKVTVKCRTHVSGIEDDEAYDSLVRFAAVVRDAGATELYVHARKGILGGLSTKQNRAIPSLSHDKVHRLAAEAQLGIPVHINGGVDTLSDVCNQLDMHPRLGGVMVGRAAYQRPWELLADADRQLHGDPNPCKSRRDLLLRYGRYGDDAVQVAEDSRSNPLAHVMKPAMNLMAGKIWSKQFRKAIHDGVQRRATATECIEAAIETVEILSGGHGHCLDEPPMPSLVATANPA